MNLSGGGTLLSVTGGKTWVNEGELTIGGDDYLYFGYTSGGTNTLTNAAGGTLNLSSTNATPLNRYTGTAVLNNEGTLNLTVSGSHAIDNSIAFHNSGTVNIDAGTLSDRKRGHRQRPVRGRCGCDAGLRRRHAHARRGDERHRVWDRWQSRVRTPSMTNDLLDIAKTGNALVVTSGGALNLNSNDVTGRLLAAVTISGGGRSISTLLRR